MTGRRLQASSSSSSPPHDAVIATYAPQDFRPHLETLRCPRARAKSSSERGKEFRARRKKRQNTIAKQNAALARQIHALLMTKAMYETVYLCHRHTPLGSLDRLVQQYYALFQNGFQAARCPECPNCSCSESQFVRAQRAFVSHAFDQVVQVGDQVGPVALLNQWSLYSAAHSEFRGEIVATDVRGTEDDPVIIVRSRVHATFSDATFQLIFHHLLGDEAFTQRLIGLQVTYDSSARFTFTAAGRVSSEFLDLDMVGGLKRSGLPLLDIARLLQLAHVSPLYTIGS